MNEIKDKNLATSIANRLAKKDVEDKAICEVEGKAGKEYRITSTNNTVGRVIKTVRYTGRDNDKSVLQDNGNGKPRPKPAKKKPAVKSKPKDVK